ncbi:MAG: hypothetical protein ACJAYU_002266 [Bradymonadia bacterium]|jgi:hypothetical protein
MTLAIRPSTSKVTATSFVILDPTSSFAAERTSSDASLNRPATISRQFASGNASMTAVSTAGNRVMSGALDSGTSFTRKKTDPPGNGPR